jgi:hypothetical protein
VRTLKVYAFASRIVRDEHHDLGIVHEGMDDSTALFAGDRSRNLDEPGEEVDLGFETPHEGAQE